MALDAFAHAAPGLIIHESRPFPNRAGKHIWITMRMASDIDWGGEDSAHCLVRHDAIAAHLAWQAQHPAVHGMQGFSAPSPIEGFPSPWHRHWIQFQHAE